MHDFLWDITIYGIIIATITCPIWLILLLKYGYDKDGGDEAYYRLQKSIEEAQKNPTGRRVLSKEEYLEYKAICKIKREKQKEEVKKYLEEHREELEKKYS